jgi:hypothetical protein
MSIHQQLQSLVGSSVLTRRQALAGLSLLALTACSRSATTPDKPAAGVAYYTCSMHASVHSPVPGKCPICGMDLIPVPLGNNGTKSSIFITPEKLRELGASVVPVETQSSHGIVSLTVPVSAVLPMGNRYLVFVDLGSGNLAPREIRVGTQTPDRYQVLSGLRAGDRVVSGALFLLDAECRNEGVLTTWGDNT